jgi:DNA-binding transcriptional MerR regulator
LSVTSVVLGALGRRIRKFEGFISSYQNFFVLLQRTKGMTMALNLNKNLKLYYSIKEVAAMFGLNESTLRYWEQEFPYLKPKTSGPAKVRQYQEKDIEQIRLIHNLVKVRGFKLAAAKKIINQNRDGADRRAEVLTRLIDIRDDLQLMKRQLDGLQ